MSTPAAVFPLKSQYIYSMKIGQYIAPFLSLSLGLLVLGCQSPEGSYQSDKERAGAVSGLSIWRGVIQLNDSTPLAFNFRWQIGKDSLHIFNGQDTIGATVNSTASDSMRINLPVFANYLTFLREGEDQLVGTYHNPDAKDYHIPFRAHRGDTFRYKSHAAPCCEVSGRWAAQFNYQEDSPRPALAFFETQGPKITGTFMTETGDYRFLEGSRSGDTIRLSAFDGGFLVYFQALVQGDSLKQGLYYSGRSYMAPWRGFRDSSFTLRDPDKLTYLKEGYNGIDFSLPDLEGNNLSLDDPSLKGKAVVVQIMGSWCPNCIDETRYLKKVYQKYHDEGLEIVGLTFERGRTRAAGLKRAQKMKRDLAIPYPVLLAGATRDDKAEEVLPMLNHVMSFPTTIFLNRDHEVVHIHTGFAGPGTPVYEDFVREKNALIQRLINPNNS